MIHVVRHELTEGENQLRCQHCGTVFGPPGAPADFAPFKLRVGEGDEPCTLGIHIIETIDVQDKPR